MQLKPKILIRLNLLKKFFARFVLISDVEVLSN